MRKRGRPKKVLKPKRPILVEGTSIYFQSPQLIAGKWRACRIDRETGTRRWFTIEGADLDRNRAYLAVAQLAEKERLEALEAERARQAKLNEARLQSGVAFLQTGVENLTPITLGEGMEGWLAYEASAGMAEATIQTTRYVFSRHVLENLGRASYAHNVQAKDVASLMLNTTVSALNIRTRLKILGMLGKFFAWACLYKHAVENPARAWAVPPTWTRESKQRETESVKEVLTVEECRTLLTVAQAPFGVEYGRVRKGKAESVEAQCKPPQWLPLAIHLALFAGLRASNVCGRGALEWKDLDLRPGQETLRIDKLRMKNRAPLEVPLAPELAETLRAYRARCGKVSGRVVLRQGVFHHAWVRLLDRVRKVDPDWNPRFRRFHDLRTTFCSLLCGATGLSADSVIVKRLRGDALRGISEDYARHIDMRILREAVNDLPRNLTPIKHLKKTITRA